MPLGKDGWKIGAVSYLNTMPLVYGMEHRNPNESLIFDLPSRLADRLATGALDVALIPSIEVFQNPAYTVVSNACIACRGPVWSVKLMSSKPLGSIRTLAMDEGSRTSVALVRLLLDRQYSISPELISLPIKANWQEAKTDAVLIIGDRAMQPEPSKRFQLEIDLGQWWLEQTGLPFVFAMWTARPGISDEGLNEIDKLLSSSRDNGLAQTTKIAKAHAAEYGLTVGQCIDYFQNYLHFTLGREERVALNRFRDMASCINLASDSRKLHYHDC